MLSLLLERLSLSASVQLLSLFPMRLIIVNVIPDTAQVVTVAMKAVIVSIILAKVSNDIDYCQRHSRFQKLLKLLLLLLLLMLLLLLLSFLLSCDFFRFGATRTTVSPLLGCVASRRCRRLVLT